jgi:hypothetical protein
MAKSEATRLGEKDPADPCAELPPHD